MGKRTFRNEIYESYKINRPNPPEELIPQFSLVKKTIELFDLPNVGVENFEADDVIGSIANHFQHDDVVIQTGDYDLLQLVDHRVTVAIMKKGIGNYEVYTMDNFYEKTGLYPEQFLDYKGLNGDRADNYPGIHGIGEKTAKRLLNKFGTFERLLENIDELTVSLQRKIQENIELFYVSRKLAAIKRDLNIDIPVEQAFVHIEPAAIERKLNDLSIRIRLNEYFHETYD